MDQLLECLTRLFDPNVDCTLRFGAGELPVPIGVSTFRRKVWRKRRVFRQRLEIGKKTTAAVQGPNVGGHTLVDIKLGLLFRKSKRRK